MGAGRWGAVTAALVGVSVVNVPAAHAADTGVAVTGLVINGGKPIVVGTRGELEVPARFAANLPAKYDLAKTKMSVYPFLYRGDLKKAADTRKNFMGGRGSLYWQYENGPRKWRYEGTFLVEPNRKWGEIDSNADATTWKVGVHILLIKKGGGYIEEYETRRATVAVKRASKVTGAAAPGTVDKGKKISVTGDLTRVNWDTMKTGAYGARDVSLQFRAVDATSFKTVKAVRTTSAGALKTTVNASVDGFYRWVYAGDAATAAATSAALYVDVR
ncbi:hypothetical protein ABZX85_18770 [Streptomyces sp. NPDC004539]|uniref:hypothetical protein n=1 Tax=Streptomyces sp. NPDC004539 TaxID=3154280 RepID=UPI0033B65030